MSTITAHDIQLMHHQRASKRDWRFSEVTGADGQVRVHLYSDDQLLGTLHGKDARHNAEMIVYMRNVLPEHIRSFEHLRNEILILRRQLGEVEAKINGNNHHEARE